MQQDTALLVMDMQANVLAGLEDHNLVLNTIASAITIARSKDIPVVFVVVGFREGGPEISRNNKIFAASKDRLKGVDTQAMLKVHPGLNQSGEDVVVVKRRVSAFSGSDLEVLLRSMGIRHIVLTGVATGGVVLSTLREAADKDYQITVLSDCCADRDEEVHRVLTQKVFPKQAEVLTAGQWM
ncbi:cysteine hydrolase family protein [Flavobacterium subsaxonicum]|uniref:Isochorismatase n=1 Tax=Flavobacterium subsaxonicum WB 4.1-42 = DSM 21790 TaxID=1121898 RepID=A0A0A2N3N5_9FLAO|nr:isochorismatase family cysteine hydrolase [Flavobacterium subsaxonicum]KGO95070.1 isochorismatase [Flavobacterium subsaxonicum WB 4.1-42 = DSM 21790]